MHHTPLRPQVLGARCQIPYPTEAVFPHLSCKGVNELTEDEEGGKGEKLASLVTPPVIITPCEHTHTQSQKANIDHSQHTNTRPPPHCRGVYKKSYLDFGHNCVPDQLTQCEDLYSLTINILLFFYCQSPTVFQKSKQYACSEHLRLNAQLLARPCIHRRLCRARSVSGYTCVAEMTSHLATELYVAFASSLILLIRSPNSYFCFSSKLQQTNGMP